MKVFISYRRTDFGIQIAKWLYKGLIRLDYQAFLGEVSIPPGERWDEEIYKNILESDVLIVVLQREVIESDWVQREVDTARAAQIRILPYLIDKQSDMNSKKEVLEKLNLVNYQWWEHTSLDDDSFPPLIKRLENLAEETRKKQQQWVDTLTARWAAQKQPAEDELRVARFRLKQFAHPTSIYLSTGRIQEARGIDVIVNTENNYLQMSRIHENYTVSSRLRVAGSLRNSQRRILEDSVQRELDAQLDYSEDSSRPVELGCVFATNAGHPQSSLRSEDPDRDSPVRYIFHAVTVSVFHDTSTSTSKWMMVPISNDEGIKNCTTACLEKIIEVDLAKGVISPPELTLRKGRVPRKEEEEIRDANEYKPIKSIIFPIFGTGHAGRKIDEVIHPMLEGIREFLRKRKSLKTLEEIHICVYHKQDINMVRDAMAEIFDPV
jgi:O-acetyl-ADP-ribose deacetylase (regulator of RNase III)